MSATDINMQALSNEQMGFSVACLDPPSQMLYNSLHSKHMSGERLTAKLNDAGQHLLTNIKGRFFSQKGNMTYTDLLQGLIYHGETILTRDPHLQYINLTILNKDYQVIHSKVGGRALLTDKRMLLLSSEFVETSSLAQHGNPKKDFGSYTMEMSCKDATYYLPISLAHFRSIELEGRTGISGSISVHSSKPPCRGLCGLLGCLKGWNPAPMVRSEYSEMTLKFGLLMPPWGEPCYMLLHLGAGAPVAYIRDIVSIFQSNAQHLQ